jgi:hypothetical protein
VPVIAAASLTVQTELRACGNLRESVPSIKNGEPTLEAQLCCEYFWQFCYCLGERRKRVALGVALESEGRHVLSICVHLERLSLSDIALRPFERNA